MAAAHELAPARLGGDFRSTDKLAEETKVYTVCVYVCVCVCVCVCLCVCVCVCVCVRVCLETEV